MSRIIWTGARASDISYTGNFFDGAITLYGNNSTSCKAFCQTKKYRINHNNITQEQTDFMMENELQMIRSDPDVEFMAYNPNLIFDCSEEVVRHTCCMNPEPVMKLLDSKISFRKFSSQFAHTLQSTLTKGKDCRVKKLQTCLPSDSCRWVVQADNASGGYKTFLLSSSNEETIVRLLHDEEDYLVSPYYKDNIPINIHAVIFPSQILITQGSIQLMGSDGERLVYRGADYITYHKIKKEVRNQFVADVEALCKQIQKLGYRGILGIDAIVVNDTALILEANNRFQASTILINKALEENALPSLHELNYEAFHNDHSNYIDQATLDLLQVGYSIYTFVKEPQEYHTAHMLMAYEKERNAVAYIGDGYEASQSAEDDAYLFRIIFDTNLVDITDQKSVRLHPNIETPEEDWYNKIVQDKDVKRIKISLLNQGVVLSEEAKEHLNKCGGMRPGVYNAVDLTLDGKYIVNSPLSVKFAALSPYLVKYDQQHGLQLYYYGNRICNVSIDPIDQTAQTTTSAGIPVGRICLLATDRLRVQNTDCCTFKENHIPCRFCEVTYRDVTFSVEDIKEAVSFYMEREFRPFRHILVGGLSNDIGKEKGNICAIIKHIRKYSDMPIYLMCLPPAEPEDIEEYVRLGVTEFGFNIEIFDRELAKQIMPGKGQIPLQNYRLALQKAVSLLGRSGAVRTAFVVGLESMDSLLKGVEYVCKLGVMPILSVFRPIPHTDMENVIPPTNQWLLELYEKAYDICREYGLKPGPECPACQNNTLSFDVLLNGE